MVGAKPKMAAIRRRQEKVVEWTNLGYATEQIARSLGVKSNTVSGDKGARRLQIAGAIAFRKRLPDPPPYDWQSPPMPEARPAYLLNAPMQRVESMLTALREMNARAKLPHNISEAAQLGDEYWFTHGQAVLLDSIRYLAEMLQIMQDEEARQAALLPAARDDVGSLDPKRAALLDRNRPKAGVGQGTKLPGKGNGILPARVFQVLMAHHWAGQEIASDEVIDSIVLREHATPSRVLEAAIELKPALKSAGWD